eukprot:UN10014
MNDNVFFETPMDTDRNSWKTKCLVSLQRGIINHPNISGSGDHVSTTHVTQIGKTFIDTIQPNANCFHYKLGLKK